MKSDLRLETPVSWWNQLTTTKGFFNSPEGLLIKRTRTLTVIHRSPVCCYCQSTPWRTSLLKKDNYYLPVVVWTAPRVIMTKDHIVPTSAGGPDNFDNYQTCCSVCNTFKGSADSPVFCQGFAKHALQTQQLDQWQFSCGGTTFSEKSKSRIRRSCMSHSTGFSRRFPTTD